MQLKIIQIALGWKREKYSLEVSNWIRSNLIPPVAMKCIGGNVEIFKLWFEGIGMPVLHVVNPLSGGESLFFHGMCSHNMSPHDMNSCNPVVWH